MFADKKVKNPNILDNKRVMEFQKAYGMVLYNNMTNDYIFRVVLQSNHKVLYRICDGTHPAMLHKQHLARQPLVHNIVDGKIGNRNILFS